MGWINPNLTAALRELSAQEERTRAALQPPADPEEGAARVWVCARNGRIAAERIHVIAPSQREAQEYLNALGVGRDVKVIGAVTGKPGDTAHGFAGPFGYDSD